MKKRPTMSNPELQGLQERFRNPRIIQAIANMAESIRLRLRKHSDSSDVVLARAARRRAVRALGLR